ncbi:MAG: hypothetical protein NC311_05810 [Muribaculaceae bacterium]|nr:hypothetical protein [Muribaculaceae bacterium]
MKIFDNTTDDSAVLCAKAIAMLSKEIAKAEATKDDDEKLKQYKTILRHAKKLRAEASKLPPDKWTDHLMRAMKMNIGSIITYTKAAIVEKDLKNMTRNGTVDMMDTIIKTIETRIDSLEKKSK